MGRICKTVARNYPALPPLKGVMIVCGFGETLKMAVDHQFEQIVTSIDRHGSFFQRKFVKPLLSLCGLDSSAFLTNFVLDEKNKDKDVTTFWFRPFPLRWFREHYQLDLVEEGKEIRCPALVIGGGKDFQLDAKYCTREMTDALLVNSPRVEIAVIPKMTHILRDTDAGDVSIWEAQEQYKVQGREPLSQELMEVMKRFVLHP
ncbi:hypothetical protein BDR26DRAFT_859299 [Obelidium mucronatum]|nr:hypothetical protein BDR26DRAFT_859299 [Obelidium mucronatum]